jgi:exodeoxyribonuclease V alpha subunit
MTLPPEPAGRRESAAWLPHLADALAEALPRLHGQSPDPWLSELIQALTTALERGEIDLDLTAAAPAGVSADRWPEAHRAALLASPLGRDPDGPLALQGERLSWRRWQRRRQRVVEDLLRRAAAAAPAAEGQPRGGGAGRAASTLADPRQRQAVEAIDRHGLVLLQGGPGTGKTSTVAHLIRSVRAASPDSRLHLAAPTGKAAARLRAAVGDAHPCTTLHRLLESRGGSFGRHRGRPLPLDLLVVDEVSMVDLALMEALLEALPDSCRLVLVGDPDQLPPVEPGGVLRELQRQENRQALGAALVTLETPYRNAGAVATVAAALRDQPFQARDRVVGLGGPDGVDGLAAIRPVLATLPPDSNLRWREDDPPALPDELIERLRLHRRRLEELAARVQGGEMAAIGELLRQRDSLLVLSPVRRGPWGVDAIHRALLGEALASPGAWPAGTPVLCSRNLPDLGLSNGDVGVLIGPPDSVRERRLLFGEADADPGAADPGAAARLVHPAQLGGAAQPAFALTVHKAQGSEAGEVIVLLPPLATSDPRLLYTALTRARRQALLISAPPPGETPPRQAGQAT